MWYKKEGKSALLELCTCKFNIIDDFDEVEGAVVDSVKNILQLFIKNKANLEESSPEVNIKYLIKLISRFTLLTYIFFFNLYIHIKNGDTPLSMICQKDCAFLFPKMLIDAGANMNTINNVCI